MTRWSLLALVFEIEPHVRLTPILQNKCAADLSQGSWITIEVFEIAHHMRFLRILSTNKSADEHESEGFGHSRQLVVRKLEMERRQAELVEKRKFVERRRCL